jgi:hypothetical protein
VFCCVAGNDGGVNAESVYCAGVLVRVLLEEIGVLLVLSDAAGLAITVGAAQGLPVSALSSLGEDTPWFAFAAAMDHVGVVPQLDPGLLRAQPASIPT